MHKTIEGLARTQQVKREKTERETKRIAER
jgi:hypothetical protein